MYEVQKDIKDELWKIIKNYLNNIKEIDYTIVETEIRELIIDFNNNDIIYDFWVVCNDTNNYKYYLDQNIYVIDVYVQQYKEGQILCLSTHLLKQETIKE